MIGDWSLQMISQDTGTGNTTKVRRNDDNVIQFLGTEVVGNNRCGSQMINRDIKESLDLASMEVNGYDTGNTSRRHQIGDELRRRIGSRPRVLRS
jgi:hypothetical protein